MRLFYFISLFLLLSSGFSCKYPADKTVIYLVRHAEKDTTVNHDDPPLTDKGKQRAQQLPQMIEEQKLKYIYTTPFERNRKTVQPLAKEFGSEIHIYDWGNWEPMVDSIKDLKGNFVICGHSNNIFPIARALGAETDQSELDANEYDKIFKITRAEGAVVFETIEFNLNK